MYTASNIYLFLNYCYNKELEGFLEPLCLQFAWIVFSNFSAIFQKYFELLQSYSFKFFSSLFLVNILNIVLSFGNRKITQGKIR